MVASFAWAAIDHDGAKIVFEALTEALRDGDDCPTFQRKLSAQLTAKGQDLQKPANGGGKRDF